MKLSVVLLLVLASQTFAQALRKTEVPAEVSALPLTLEAQLPFTCTHEKPRIPQRNAKAQKLFRYAQWRYDRNFYAQEGAFDEVQKLYRIAAAWGHDKAAEKLVEMLREGLVDAPDKKTLPVDLAEDFIRRGIPYGYYLLSLLLEEGEGVHWNRKAALQYLRKAADLGSPEAQHSLGDQLIYHSYRPEDKGEHLKNIGREMRRCAAKQGHAKAAFELASYELLAEKKLAEALHHFQKAVKGGNASAAEELQKAFGGEADEWREMGLAKDMERSKRYEKIYHTLYEHQHKGFVTPTVEELNNIVPLPPARLPAWSGTIQWQKNVKAHKAPPLPSPKHIHEMARAKGLNPQNAWPLGKEAK